MEEEAHDFQKRCLGEEVEGYNRLVLSDLIPSHSRIATLISRTSFYLSEKRFCLLMYHISSWMKGIRPFHQHPDAQNTKEWYENWRRHRVLSSV